MFISNSSPFPVSSSYQQGFKQLLLLAFVLAVFTIVCNASFHIPKDLKWGIYQITEDVSGVDLFISFSPYLEY